MTYLGFELILFGFHADAPEVLDSVLGRGAHAPETEAPELTKRQLAYVAGVHQHAGRELPDLATEKGDSGECPTSCVSECYGSYTSWRRTCDDDTST